MMKGGIFLISIEHTWVSISAWVFTSRPFYMLPDQAAVL